MKIKAFALILALAAIMTAQTVNPSTSDKDTAAPGSNKCACCEKTAVDSKDMPCCQAKDTKGEMACCHGKGAQADMACCKAEGAKACMRAGKGTESCCGKNAACCQKAEGCCGAKDKTERAANGCCADGKCDRKAHQHATGM